MPDGECHTFSNNARLPDSARPFVRVGETHYSQLEILYSQGKLPIRRAIFDESKLKHQDGFIKTLRDDQIELTLDTKAAELAAPGRFQSNPAKSLEQRRCSSRVAVKRRNRRPSLSRRLSWQAQRNEKMRASLENLHSVRGLSAPRAARAHLSERIDLRGKS